MEYSTIAIYMGLPIAGVLIGTLIVRMYESWEARKAERELRKIFDELLANQIEDYSSQSDKPIVSDPNEPTDTPK